MAPPPATDAARSLRLLARELGVQTEYRDLTGTRVRASQAALRSVVAALGVPIESSAEATTALRALQHERAQNIVDVVHVVWDSAATPLRVAPQVSGTLHCTLQLEDGSQRTLTIDAGRGGDATLPAGIPLGYHRLEVESTAGTSHSHIICAPRHTHAGSHDRTWGVFLPLYAARSEHDWGIGDLGSARKLLDLVSETGGGLVGTTPLLATFLDEPFEPSPYAPVSRMFWNECYLDLQQLPELNDSTTARAMLGDSDVLAKRDRLRELALVDHRAVYQLKRPIVAACAHQLLRTDSARRQAFEAWRAANPMVGEYAEFRQQRELTGAAAVNYHQYAQWCMQTQLAELAQRPGAGLYLDLPLGVHPDGFDRARYADLFTSGMSIGAPPDPLAEGGQNWGLPPLHPQRLRASGYAYQIASIRNLFRHASAARIDHVMGLHRLFWIPTELDAQSGVYVSYESEEQWAIICLESDRSGCLVVGEDLGTVPPTVRAAMAEHDARRTYVMQFELQPDNPNEAIRPAPLGSLAAINTHDTPTWAAMWDHKLDEPTRMAITRFLYERGLLADGEISSEKVNAAALRLLAAGDADAVIANLEDFWGEALPQNVPGTGSQEAPNWVRRATRSIESLRNDDDLLDLLRDLTKRRAGSSEQPLAPKDPTMTSRSRSARKKRTAAPSSAVPSGPPETISTHRVRHDVSLLTDADLYLFAEGTNNRMHQLLGSHPHTAEGVAGTWFAVWAPNAERVSVIGDFNGWTPDEAPLAPHAGGSGIWHGWIPGVVAGEHYKYQIASSHDGYQVQKADPYARRAEMPPRTASIVWDSSHDWTDSEWMKTRCSHNSLDAPMSVYELHTGSWMRVPEDGNRSLTWHELAPKLIKHIHDTGFTHVQLMPIMEHPFFGSWGYQTTGYFAPTSRHGSPDDFKFFVDELHQAGIGVLLDWVPSHFPTDQHGLDYFDGTHLYEHADPKQGFHPDWKSDIFNYSRNEVRSFLLSSAMYWLEEYHVDGLRVDAVASMLYLDYSRKDGEWVANVHGGRENLEAIDFLRRLNQDAYGEQPDIAMIAEESTAWGGVSRPTYTGGLGFGMKWDMGWMHDTLEYFKREPIHRRHHQSELTFRQIYAYTENFMLPLSHDEVVHGKGSLLGRMPGDEWQQFANLRLLLSYMWALPGKKLLFMGGEFGQGTEWNHDTSLAWHQLDEPQHRGVQQLVSDLNRLHRDVPALHELDMDPSGFAWVDTSDEDSSAFSWLRFARSADDAPVLVALNATPVARTGYRIGVPSGGHWRELFNSDAQQYWGGGHGNFGGVEADPIPTHGHDWSLSLSLPPLGAVMLQPAGGDA